MRNLPLLFIRRIIDTANQFYRVLEPPHIDKTHIDRKPGCSHDKPEQYERKTDLPYCYREEYNLEHDGCHRGHSVIDAFIYPACIKLQRNERAHQQNGKYGEFLHR